MTATQRAVVDDLGNINVHGRSALELVWKVKDADGNLVDISASDLFFEIDTKLRIELTAGEDNYSRKLTLSRAQIATLPLNQPLQYALHDETPSSPATIWNGRVTAYGFRTAPSGAAAVDPGVASWTGATVIVQQGESVPTVVVTYMGATGYGMPSGGTVGQYIRKSSSTPYDVAWDTVTGSDVGLGNVDNTSDANKPVSTAQQAALDLKVNLAGGTLSGVLAFIAGTAALPGLAVAGDLNTGIYGVSADVLGVSAGGVQVQTWGVGTSTLTGHFQPGADATYKLGDNNARFIDGYLSRRLLIGGSAPAGTANLSSIQSFGQNWSLIGGDVLTDATDKTTRLGALHYLAAEEPFVLLSASSSAAANTIQIGGGTGFGNAATNITFYTGANTTTLTGTQRWQIDQTGAFFPGADNTYDIGASGANRPRDLNIARNIVGAGYIQAGAGSYIFWFGRTLMAAPSNGVITLSNNAANDFSRLQLGGTTSAFPSIGRNGAGIWLRLADNSSHANLECAAISAYGEVRSSARLHAYFTTAIPAGGTAGVGVRVSDATNFGVFFGSGAPTLSAAKGSLYLRSDGSGTSDRMYVNTDGETAWTAVTTAA